MSREQTCAAGAGPLPYVIPHPLLSRVGGEMPARAIWAVIGRLDLGAFYSSIDARIDVAGAPAIAPKVLLSLWVYATSNGEGSAREVWRLTQEHAAYRFPRGGSVPSSLHGEPSPPHGSRKARRPAAPPPAAWR